MPSFQKIGTKLKKGQLKTAAVKSGTKVKQFAKSGAKIINKNKKTIGAVLGAVAVGVAAYKKASVKAPVKMGYSCTKKYNKTSASAGDRAKSCSKVPGGKFATRQLCVEKCHH